MIDCRFKPITRWPGKPTPSYNRKHSRFKAGWQTTLDLLERELNYLKAKDINIEGFFSPSEIRNDGWPRSSARPTQPGVVLSFSTKKGRMVMPCDLYKDWEANLRAIALTLEHLRAVERYGVTTEEQEQYTGWLKLPAAAALDELTTLAERLIEYASASIRAEQILGNLEMFNTVWREAVRRTHTDVPVNASSSDEFRQVIEARDRIKALKGWQ